MTGEKLGTHGPAIPVEIVKDFTEKPTFLQKCFRQAPEPRFHKETIYVCCPECTAKVKSDPSRYSLAVYAERRGLLPSGSLLGNEHAALATSRLPAAPAMTQAAGVYREQKAPVTGKEPEALGTATPPNVNGQATNC